MKFQNFVLRADNNRDPFCKVSTSSCTYYHVRVFGIWKEIDTQEIFIRGRYFENVRPMFGLPCNSHDVGIALCQKLSLKSYIFPLSALINKCFAFPSSTLDAAPEDTKWTFIDYLH